MNKQNAWVSLTCATKLDFQENGVGTCGDLRMQHLLRGISDSSRVQNYHQFSEANICLMGTSRPEQ